ncbi:MAG: hypothetical protein ABFR33_06395 [Verrucomicrobiota bacterium]
MLDEFESLEVPLSAVWVFDLPQQEGEWNISPSDDRTYMIDAVGNAN